MKKITQLLLLVFVLLISLAGVSQELVARIEIRTEGLLHTDIPISSKTQSPSYSVTRSLDYPIRVQLKSGTVSQGSVFQLYEIVENERIFVSSQIRYGEFDELSWVMESNGDSIRIFELTAGAIDIFSPQSESKMRSSINDTSIVLLKNDNQILQYRHALLPPPPGKADKWARSGFIHPLYSPSGEVLTWVQPPDHLHHMGLWNPWTKVSWKGNHTDFWNLGKELGTVRFKNIVGIESGDVYSEFRVAQDHVAFIKTQEYNEVVVMTEEWIVRVWNISEGYFLDFTSVLTNVTDDTVSLDAYRYGGGLGYRATQKWDNTNSKVLTSEGKIWENGDATRAKWCRISGELNGIETGLLFLSDPGNYDFPQPMRIWPMNSNGGKGNQYFEFTPIREKAWVLEPGKSYSQRYRIWVHEGGLNAEQAEDAWRAYAFPTETNILYLDKSQ